MPLHPHERLGQVVYRLVTELEKPCSVQGFASDDAVLLLPGQGKLGAIVVRVRADNEAEQMVAVRRLRRGVGFPLVVIALGAKASATKIARRSAPIFTPGKQQWLVIDDEGTVTGSAKSSLIGELLQRPAAEIGTDAWREFLERCAADANEAGALRQEFAQFTQQRRSNPPRVTIAFLVAMVLMYGLQLLFGGPEALPVLLRMGGLRAEAVQEGEIYRLLSVAMLHGDHWHLLLNGYVLWILGRFLEQIIGSWRFTVLLLASIIGGSLASLFSMDVVVSVGASGGLWGVLAGHAVLAFRPQGLLPEAMIKGARKAAAINLLINLSVSFLPRVDWAAHLGGGLVG